MKYIIPAKASSTRVTEKNFRPFLNGKSLVDLTAEKLLQITEANQIYLSCEDPSKKSVADSLGINFALRDPYLCDNDTPFFDLFNGVCQDIPGSDEIAWCQVIDPLFDEYQACLQSWHEEKGAHDSLVVVYPHRKYLLDPNFFPIGFGFGFWHVKSQLLPQHYELTFSFSILKRECIKLTGCHIGARPFWYLAEGHHVDIDTPEDFELASMLCELREQRKSR